MEALLSTRGTLKWVAVVIVEIVVGTMISMMGVLAGWIVIIIGSAMAGAIFMWLYLDERGALPVLDSAYVPLADVRDIGRKLGLPLHTRDAAASNAAFDLENALTELAANKIGTIKGREWRRGLEGSPLIPIPADHFRRFNVAHGVLSYPDAENRRSHTTDRFKRLEENTETVFYDLHVPKWLAKRAIKRVKKAANQSRQ